MRIRLSIAFLLVLIVIVASFAAATAQSSKSAAEGLGIKHVPVPAGTKIDDLIKAEGTLVEVPLAALEGRLERLAKSQADAKQSPRLVKAIYRAEVAGNHLTKGNGQWWIEHGGTLPAIFPLPSFNLALARPPRLEGREALLGDLDGVNLGLWIEKAGTQTVEFDWSLRGTPGVQGAMFDLRIPPCPLVSIELKLPADQTLVMPKTAGLLTGPHETENPAFKVWKLQVTGRSQVEFMARRGAESGQTPRIFVLSGTSVQFSPEQTLYDVDAQIEVLHAPVSELVFEVDATLQAYEVSSRQLVLQSWRVEPAPVGPKSGKNRSLLKIQLREPLLGQNGLRLRFQGPRWSEQETVVPHISMRGAIAHNETLKLHLHPDQHLERWNSGSFALIHSSTESDGSQLLTLADTHSDGKGQRPRFLVRTGGVDFTVSQDTRWRINPHGMTLTSEIQYDVSRGQLFGFDVRLPKNAKWRISQVDLQPREALQKWSVAGGVLHVDLQRGITPRSDCKLLVTLEDERDKASRRPSKIDIPDLAPLGAKARQGALAILADAHEHISLESCNLATSRPDPNAAKDARLQFFFAFRQTPVQGRIKLEPQHAVLQARTQQQVTMTPEFMRVKANVTIEPIVGQTSYVDLLFSDSGRQPWKIEAKGAEIARKERLPLGEIALVGLRLAAPYPPSRAINLLAPRGPIWRVHFREPLTKAVELVVQHDIGFPGSMAFIGTPPPFLPLDHGLGLAVGTLLTRIEREWRVPIVVPLDAERIDGEVSLLPLGTALTSVQPRGLETAALPGAGAANKAVTRFFRFKNAGLMDTPSLRVKANRRLNDDTAQAILDLAELTTSVDPAGNVAHHLRVSVWNWRARDFRVVLPARVHVITARLNRIDLERLPQRVRDEGLEVLVPMGEGPGAQTVEIIYESEPNTWFGALGRVIAAPIPKLPLPPLMIQRGLRLGPDWLPLRQEEFFSLDRRSPAHAALRETWRAGEGLLDELMPNAGLEWIERQRLSLLSAEGSLRRAGPREMSLAEAFSKLLDDPKLDQAALVVDRAALRGLGLSPKSSIALAPESGSPFWEALGLVYVPTPHAALLTSKDRFAHWAWSIREGNETGILLARAVAQGFASGQDSSGQFCAADFWLRTESPADHYSTHARLFESAREGVTAWQPIAGISGDESIVVVHSARVHGAAVLIAFAVGGMGLVLRRMLSVAAFFRGTWLALCVCALGLMTAPLSIREWALAPLIVVVFLLGDSYRRLLGRMAPGMPRVPASRSTQKLVKPSLVGVVFIAASIFGFSQAQGPEPKKIFVVDDLAGREARAFVRPELLRWLDLQEKQIQSLLADVVFLGAHYRGRWEQETVLFRADFDVFTSKDQATVIIPLVGVDLMEGNSLDGLPIFPTVAPEGQSGYQIIVPAKGKHRLSLSFLARPSAAGELKFSGPPTACSSLHVSCPIKVGAPRLLRAWGDVALHRDTKKGEEVLDAQLGHEPTIHLKGSATTSAAPISALNVREFYFWDLRPRHHSVQAVLAYRATSEVEHLEVQFPSGLEVRTVELAEAIPGQSSGAIKAWRLVSRDDGRVLQVDFLQPLSGAFQLLLGMAPRWSNADHFELRLPTPLRAESINGMLGFRIDVSDAATKVQSLSFTAEAPDIFVKEWAALTPRSVDPQHAFKFVRGKSGAAKAAFEVTLAADKPRVQSEVVWTALPQTVDLLAQLNVSVAAPVDDFYLLPINLSQKIVLRDVQGPDVHHWSRQGDKLHVWLVGPRKKTSITLIGWVPHEYPKNKTVNLPTPSVTAATIDGATLTLASACGLALEPMASLIEEVPREPGQRRFRSAIGRFPAEFQLRTRTAQAEYQVLTTAEMHGATCTLGAHIQGKIDFGDFPELRFRLSNWPAAAPRLSLAIPGARAQHSTAGNEHVWSVTLPKGTPQQFTFNIKGQWPLNLGKTLKLPEIRIERGGQLGEQIIALAGLQFVGAPVTGAPALKTSAVGAAATKDFLAWPLEHARLRNASAQYVKCPVGVPLPVVQPRESVAEAPASILSARHQILVGERGRWLRRTTWSLWTKLGHDLDIELPRGAAFAAAYVDNQPATPRQTGPDTLSLSLPPNQKPHTVVVYWTMAAESETFRQPLLASARLAGLASVPVLGELLLPAGWRVAETNGIGPDTTVLLAEIQAEARATQILSDELGAAGKAAQGPLVQSLQSFAALVDRAQYRLRVAMDADSRTREAWESNLKSLIDEESKRAKSLGLETVRLAGEKSPWLVAPSPVTPGDDNGAPLVWQQEFDKALPTVTLRTSAESPARLSLLPLAIVVLVLSFWPLGLATWVRLWPEQLLAVTSLGFALGGFSIIGVGVLLVAVIGRTLSLIHGARRYHISRRA